MNKNDKRLTIKTIDGQEFVFPTKDGWKELSKNPVIDNTKVYYDDNVGLSLNFINAYPELSFGIIYYPAIKVWIPMAFVTINAQMQRCHLEHLTCETCGWQGITAYPLQVDLYPSKDLVKLMKKARDFGKKPCPQCKGELPRFPIWIEPSSPSKK